MQRRRPPITSRAGWRPPAGRCPGQNQSGSARLGISGLGADGACAIVRVPQMKKDDKGEDFGALLAEFEKSGAGRGKQRVAVGDVVRGRVISVGREAVFLTLADGKTEGVLGLEELRNDDGDVKVAVGDELEARVIELGDKGDNVVLRRLVRKGPEAKAELAQAFELGIPVEGV